MDTRIAGDRRWHGLSCRRWPICRHDEARRVTRGALHHRGSGAGAAASRSRMEQTPPPGLVPPMGARLGNDVANLVQVGGLMAYSDHEALDGIVFGRPVPRNITEAEIGVLGPHAEAG